MNIKASETPGVCHARDAHGLMVRMPTQPLPTRWQILRSAPHRPLFLMGMLQVVLVMGLWLVALVGRASPGASPAMLLPPVAAHGFLVLYGIFPFFVFGFLFTVYPRWMEGPTIGPRIYSLVATLLLAGQLIWYVGLYAATGLLALALIVTLVGWGLALMALYRCYRRAPRHGTHEPLLNAALAAGALGVALHLAGIVLDWPQWLAAGREVALWLFLVPVVFLVAHRMIPFFSSSIIMNYLMVRPAWGPPLILACAMAHAALELAGLPQWRFLADTPLAVAALHHSWVWQFRASFHARLLAMLHIAFLWLGIAMTLYALQSVLLLATATDWLGRAPLHALGIGFLTGMIVAMGSRVTLGHSGHALAADALTWVALLGLNATAIIRLTAELMPAYSAGLNVAAATLWLVFLVPWVARYAPLFLRARADGRPG